MTQSKTFRLFLSSTFDDFALERDAIQQKVFPKLHKLCRENEFEFMPIDLRWGVNVDAQLDQRTMDLCLKEVKECTCEPRPDFIILAGDRYGWIPLPYTIEQNEFDTLFEYVNDKDKKLVNQWYKLDNNQLPPSYILQKREIGSEFEDDDKWQSVENTLRSILQKAILKTTLDENIKEKYFTSATEFEFRDFIDKIQEEKSQSLFFINRNIEKNTLQSKKFFGDEKKQKAFKEFIKSHTLDTNEICLYTSLKDEKSISDSHIDEMVELLTQKLTTSIEEEIQRVNSLQKQSEKEYQAWVKKDLSKNIIGRDQEIAKIIEYTQSNNTKPYLLYGASGMGKSSVMACAIKKSKEDNSARVIYRFAGKDEKSTSTKTLFTSILKELNLHIPSFDEREENESLLIQQDEKKDTFEYEVYEALQSIQEPTIIYIDALDQLGDKSKCDWLPSNLNPNLKIVISLLNDEHYEEDSYYFDLLQHRGELQEILPLDSKEIAYEIVLNTLKSYNRTLQSHQLEYIYNLYKNINSPLYLTIVSQEARFWDSQEKDLELADTQKGAISEYIENLTKLFHHEKLLVEKTLGYIYASRNSLSEAMLTEILSKDKELLEVVENKFHNNISKKLPTAVWARLHHQIAPFLKRNENGAIGFFHREFSDAAKHYYSDKRAKELLAIIEQSIIEQLIKEDYYCTTSPSTVTFLRDIHINIFTLFQMKYPKVFKESSIKFITKSAKENEEWVDEYLEMFNDIELDFSNVNTINNQIAYLESFLLFAKPLYEITPDRWAVFYAKSLNALAVSYFNINRIDEAIKLEEESLAIRKKSYKKSPDNLTGDYTTALSNLAILYNLTNRTDEAIKLGEESLAILKELYEKHPDRWLIVYSTSLNKLASIYKNINRIDEAIMLIEQSLAIRKELYEKNPDRWAGDYATALSNLASLYKDINHIDEAIKLGEESLTIRKELYEKNPDYWAEDYATVLNNLANLYKNSNRTDKSIELEKQSLSILKELYEKNTDRWAGDYATVLDNLAIIYKNINCIDEAIKLGEKSLAIRKELYETNPVRWSIDYSVSLNNLAIIYKNINRIDEAIMLIEQSLTIRKELYEKHPDHLTGDYASALSNLAHLYEDINRIDEAIMLIEQSLAIRKELYEKNTDRWAGDYATVLDNLARLYEDINRIDEAIKLGEESLTIQKKLYKKHPDRWTEDYATTLSNLASFLSKTGEYKLALKYFKGYFQIIDFNKKNDITSFIYPFIKWYQCEVRLVNHDKLIELNLLSKDLIRLYKNKLGNRYNDVIKKNEITYKEFADNSDNYFNKEKYEIFMKIFYYR